MAADLAAIAISATSLFATRRPEAAAFLFPPVTTSGAQGEGLSWRGWWPAPGDVGLRGPGGQDERGLVAVPDVSTARARVGMRVVLALSVAARSGVRGPWSQASVEDAGGFTVRRAVRISGSAILDRLGGLALVDGRSEGRPVCRPVARVGVGVCRVARGGCLRLSERPDQGGHLGDVVHGEVGHVYVSGSSRKDAASG